MVTVEIITCQSAQNKRSVEYSALNRTSISPSSKAQTSSIEEGEKKTEPEDGKEPCGDGIWWEVEGSEEGQPGVFSENTTLV